MAFPPFTSTTKLADKTETTTQQIVRAFNKLVSNLQDIFQALLNKVQLDSILLEHISLQPGSNTINHTLGRQLTGYSIVMKNVAINDYATDLSTTSFNLHSDVAATVSLLVF